MRRYGLIMSGGSMKKGRVIVGMSGGVDSSVAAYLLKEEGYDVTGVTMQIWQPESDSMTAENGGCCGLSAVEDARSVAAHIGIPHYVMNFRDVFQKTVIDYFVREYQSGRTPNPCIACNRYVKWEALLNKALAIGADYIATGHYARVVTLPDGRMTLREAPSSKDQTYALYQLTQEQLKHTLMPLGEYTKDEIRRIAAKAGLPVASKPDSQEICFVPDNNYAGFIEKETGVPNRPGNFVSEDGRVLGTHRGIACYTIGQRKHLGLSFGYPVFVSEIRPQTNEVVLTKGNALFKDNVEAEDLNFMMIPALDGERRVIAKLRYSHKGAPAVVKMKGSRLICRFDEPQRAPTPGQALVLYEDHMILGGGTIQ